MNHSLTHSYEYILISQGNTYHLCKHPNKETSILSRKYKSLRFSFGKVSNQPLGSFSLLKGFTELKREVIKFLLV